MANRVNVNINVNDNSRSGLRALRQNMRQTQRQIRQAGGRVRFTVTVNPGTSRRDLRRIQRQMRGLPVVIPVRVNPANLRGQLIRRRIRRALGGAITLPVRLGTRGLVGSVRGTLRNTGAVLGGILSDGLGQGIINGLQKAGPVGMAVLSGIILGALAVLGAAMAGVLVLAFGGAFVAIAAIAATQFGMITDAWQREKDRLKPLFKEAVEPIVPVIEHAISLLGDLGAAFAPAFEKFLAEAAPQLEDFLDSIGEGFRKFGDKAWEPMTNAFRVFLDAFGPHWEGFMEDLGSSFGALGRTVSRHSTEIGMALRAVLQLIVFLIDIVNFLANTWVQGIRIMTFAAGLFLKGLALMVNGVMGAVETILSALGPVAKALGMGDAINAARTAIQTWKENTAGTLEAAGQSAMDFGKTLDRANRKRQLEVDIASFKNRLAIARADLKKTADKKAQAKLRADISDLNNKIATARAQLNALNGKTATTYVDVWTRNRTYGGNSVTGARAMGGVTGSRAASGGVRSNMTLVGEAGPEIVDLPPGSRVRTAGDSQRMMGGGGGSSAPMVLEIRSGGSRLDDLLVEILKRAVHIRGGDVQVVLGRT